MYVRRIALATMLALVTAGSALAGDTRSQQLGALKDAQERLARLPMQGRAQGTSSVDPQLLADRNQVDGLIADLESGKKVDPSAVDRALKAANNPCW